jgi:hypothetical protein
MKKWAVPHDRNICLSSLLKNFGIFGKFRIRCPSSLRYDATRRSLENFSRVFNKYAAGFFPQIAQMPQILIFIIRENPRNLRTLFPKQSLPPRPPVSH